MPGCVTGASAANIRIRKRDTGGFAPGNRVPEAKRLPNPGDGCSGPIHDGASGIEIHLGKELARDEVRDEAWKAGSDAGEKKGKEEGIEEGKKQEFERSVRKMLMRGFKPDDVAAILEVDIDKVKRIVDPLD